MRILSVFVAVLLSYSAVLSHDIHVSVTDVEISDDGHVEVVVKVFLDDLMHSLGLEMGAALPANYTSSDDLINQFLADNFELTINGKSIKFELEDTTHSTPAVWITLTGQIEEAIESIHIQNKILIALFDDQTNMVNVAHAGERYSELLDGDNTIYKVAVGK